ncbi:MAG TPA: PQQ-binding-like beta-propeller repeat protein [Actinomycetota bacterium]|nr:PQQ-binding-like beta-propeller repeat protein [Actinomycetota bacterium]
MGARDPRTARLRSKLLRTFSRAAPAALALVCLGGSAAHAQEGGFAWSQFQGGPGHPGTIAQAPAPPYRQLWRFMPPEGSLSAAVIADDLAIAVGQQAVFALDLATGDLTWEIPRDGGPLSTPALGTVGDRRVLVYVDGPPNDDQASSSPTVSSSPTASASPTEGGASRDAVSSDLVAIDLADRSELWRTTLDHRSRSGVTIDGERAYVADDEGTVYAIDLDGGSVTWMADAAGRVESPVAVADGNVYVAAQAQDQPRVEVLALDVQSGEPAWPRFSTSGYLASAISAGDGVVVVAVDRVVRAFGADNGRVRWESLGHGLFWPVSAPAASEGAIFAADESGGVYRIDASSGDRNWGHQTNERVVRSSPVLAGGSVIVGLGGGELAAFDPSNGDLVWTTPATPGYLGAIALSADVLVAVKGGGGPGLVTFEHDPDSSLEREVSPTVLDPAVLFGAFALAFVLAGVAVLVPFRLVRGRVGPAFTRDAEAGAQSPPEEGRR